MQTHKETQRSGHVMMEAKIGMIYKLRNSRNHQKLEEAGKDPPLETSGGETP